MTNEEMAALLKQIEATMKAIQEQLNGEAGEESQESITKDEVDYLGIVEELLDYIPIDANGDSPTCVVIDWIGKKLQETELNNDWNDVFESLGYVLCGLPNTSGYSPWAKWLTTLHDYLEDEYNEPDHNVTWGEFCEAMAYTIYRHGYEVYRKNKLAGKVVMACISVFDVLREIEGEGAARAESRPKKPTPPVDPDAPFSH